MGNNMKKFLVLGCVSVGLLSTNLSADALKNSLTNIMKTDDSTQMVDLSNISLNAKPRPVKKVRKNRSGKTVIGTVNGHKILKKDADAYLTQRTRGKITNSDVIPPKQQKMLMQELALPILALDAAKKELTPLEKETVFNRTWMQKEAAKTQITDDDVHVIYDKLKQESADHNDTRPIPPFDAIKNRLKMQMVEKKIMTEIMKDVKITVAD